MTSFVIAFESNPPLDDEKISIYIKASGEAMEVMNDLWILETEKEAKQLRDDLRSLAGDTGRVFIVKSGRTAAWSNIVGQNKWLVDHL